MSLSYVFFMEHSAFERTETIYGWRQSWSYKIEGSDTNQVFWKAAGETVKADERAPDTREPQPRKDLVTDQAVTNCMEVGHTNEVTKESEKPKKGS